MSKLPQSQAAARDLLEVMRAASKPILAANGIRESPGRRVTTWEDGRGPAGMAYHWTGGWSWKGAANWLNFPWTIIKGGETEPGNRGSSAQVLIMDRDCIGDAWPAELRSLFPVPTLILSPWTASTWCTNWVNKLCVGVELRNSGPWRKGETHLGKAPMMAYGQQFEPYTQEQMISAINLGRLVRQWRGDKLDPKWIVGHSMISINKADPGPLCPMHRMRWAIWDTKDPAEYWWVQRLPEAPSNEGVDEPVALGDDDRNGPDLSEMILVHDKFVGLDDPGFATEALWWLGWQVGPEQLPPAALKEFVSYYQRHTRCTKNKTLHLKVDGVPGPKTCASMDARLRRLGLR